jgi:putative addiction module component (TIGR02574 family)
MTRDAILKEAMQLSDDDRARLIDDLWATMRPEKAHQLTPAQAEDLQKRIAEDDAGLSNPQPWEVVREQLQRRTLWCVSISPKEHCGIFNKRDCGTRINALAWVIGFTMMWSKRLTESWHILCLSLSGIPAHEVLFVDEFPYRIIYRIRSGVVRVLAIYHLKRDPHRWDNR